MSEWRPIETAPLDGTPVLLYVPAVNSWNRVQGMNDRLEAAGKAPFPYGLAPIQWFPPGWRKLRDDYLGRGK